ncbi:TusA-related sulfurtransferase [Psychrobacter sp. PL19]|uniref:sulfurtransferase TusA family protein n=1 Tax=Psychrobacter sp. PL19 TaxID=2760711 RepID=UPI001AE7EBCB
MSVANDSSTTMHAPYQLSLAQTLPKSEQCNITSLLTLLPTGLLTAGSLTNKYIKDIQLDGDDGQKIASITIKNLVDGRGLACPMPLLKTKVALRGVATGESLYVVATDPNSQADIIAFCQQTQQTAMADTLLLLINQVTDSSVTGSASTQTLDTIFHFIITKTDSN